MLMFLDFKNKVSIFDEIKSTLFKPIWKGILSIIINLNIELLNEIQAANYFLNYPTNFLPQEMEINKASFFMVCDQRNSWHGTARLQRLVTSDFFIWERFFHFRKAFWKCCLHALIFYFVIIKQNIYFLFLVSQLNLNVY